MLTCYYAHFMGTYNTPTEERDMDTLTDLGFNVTNPNSPYMQKMFEGFRLVHPENYMAFFEQEAARHDICAFRALPDGSIPGGVVVEVAAAKEAGKIIIELPCGIKSRSMDYETTVEYLENIGQR